MRQGRVIVAVVVTAIACGLLLSPMPYDPTRLVEHGDKWAHAGLFATLAVVWRAAGTRRRWLVLGGVVFAAGSELLQLAMGLGRHADVLDALADLAGVALVIVAISVGKRLWPAEPEPAIDTPAA